MGLRETYRRAQAIEDDIDRLRQWARDGRTLIEAVRRALGTSGEGCTDDDDAQAARTVNALEFILLTSAVRDQPLDPGELASIVDRAGELIDDIDKLLPTTRARPAEHAVDELARDFLPADEIAEAVGLKTENLYRSRSPDRRGPRLFGGATSKRRRTR